jgi:hypothetical protein
MEVTDYPKSSSYELPHTTVVGQLQDLTLNGKVLSAINDYSYPHCLKKYGPLNFS